MLTVEMYPISTRVSFRVLWSFAKAFVLRRHVHFMVPVAVECPDEPERPLPGEHAPEAPRTLQ